MYETKPFDLQLTREAVMGRVVSRLGISMIRPLRSRSFPLLNSLGYRVVGTMNK